MSHKNKEYRNKVVVNQRGASIDINNSSDREEIKISQFSGSNITLNNLVNSELATNNKQTRVEFDKFDSTGHHSNEFVGKDKSVKVVENSYTIKGIQSPEQIDKLKEWRSSYKSIAEINSQFKLLRGGKSYPNGVETEQFGSRGQNPTLNGEIYSVENRFQGYSGVPVRTSAADQVTAYVKVPDAGLTIPATTKNVHPDKDVITGAGIQLGSGAFGVIKYGPNVSGSTEKGIWTPNKEAAAIGQTIIDTQDKRSEIEKDIGNGGDDIEIIKRHKTQIVGPVINNFPSVRIDEEGRSQPVEMVVGQQGSFKNFDSIPHVEEISNENNYPCGDYTLQVGNKYNVIVGSGGIQIKTSGALELGGSTVKMSGYKVNIHASKGVNIASDNAVEIQSIKSITLRSNRQVFVEPALGVKNNLILGGGIYSEGEVYLHHVTAPLEVQQTEDTILLGKFATDVPRRLKIGEALVGGNWYPVYALASDDLIINYPHSHHFNNLPLRLMEANEDVRQIAQLENINKHDNKSISLEQQHERKIAIRAEYTANIT